MKVTIDANYLRALFSVICMDDIRTYLHGIHLKQGENKVYATDGHRLLVAPVEVEASLISTENFQDGITFKVPKKPARSDRTVTLETGRNRDRFEEIVWSYYDKNGKLTEQLISHLVGGTYPSVDFIFNQDFGDNNASSIGFNPAYLLDVYSALGYRGGVNLLMGKSNTSVFKVEFGAPCKADYYIMPMRY